MKLVKKLAKKIREEAYNQASARLIARELNFSPQKVAVEIFKKQRSRLKPTPEPRMRVAEMYIEKALLGHEGRHDSSLSYNVFRSKKKEILAIVNMSGWCQYSRTQGYYIDRSALVGKDDGQWFSTRIPSTITDVKEAMEWMKPAEVKRAEKEGRKVFRQGDIFLVETINPPRVDQSFGDHQVRYENLKTVVEHPEHGQLTLDGVRWKTVRRKSLLTNGTSD